MTVFSDIVYDMNFKLICATGSNRSQTSAYSQCCTFLFWGAIFGKLLLIVYYLVHLFLTTTQSTIKIKWGCYGLLRL